MTFHDSKPLNSPRTEHPAEAIRAACAPVRVGVLGFGRQGRRLAEALTQRSGTLLGGIGRKRPESNGASAEAASDRTFVPHTVPIQSYRDIIDADDIDAVVVALPNHLHFEWCREALRAGKHVLCEKPLGLSLTEVRELDELARERRLHLGEAFSYPFHPQHARVSELIHGGAIGELRLLEGRYQYTHHDTTDIRWQRECGGGALNDAGCYLLDWASRIAGTPSTMKVDAVLDQHGVDTVTAIQLFYPTGTLAQLTCGMVLPRENYVRITGTEGSIFLGRAFLVPPGSKCALELRSAKGTITRESFPGHDQTGTMLDAFVALCNRSVTQDTRFGHLIDTATALDTARSQLQGETALP